MSVTRTSVPSPGGTISNWLRTPEIPLDNGAELSFWTRTVAGSIWPDRLQVRMSTSGSSTNVGTGPEDVGDFDVLLLDINEGLTSSGYPEAWTEFLVTIEGLAGPTQGRLAFRYYVTDGGPSGTNSNYIGIDTVEFTEGGVPAPTATPEATPTATPEPAMMLEPPSMSVMQAPGQSTEHPTMLYNMESDPMTWTVTEAVGSCSQPSAIPWLSVSPANGTTPPSSQSMLMVTVDADGLAEGTHEALLCLIEDTNHQMAMPISLRVMESSNRLFLPMIER